MPLNIFCPLKIERKVIFRLDLLFEVAKWALLHSVINYYQLLNSFEAATATSATGAIVPKSDFPKLSRKLGKYGRKQRFQKKQIKHQLLNIISSKHKKKLFRQEPMQKSSQFVTKKINERYKTIQLSRSSEIWRGKRSFRGGKRSLKWGNTLLRALIEEWVVKKNEGRWGGRRGGQVCLNLTWMDFTRRWDRKTLR